MKRNSLRLFSLMLLVVMTVASAISPLHAWANEQTANTSQDNDPSQKERETEQKDDPPVEQNESTGEPEKKDDSKGNNQEPPSAKTEKKEKGQKVNKILPTNVQVNAQTTGKIIHIKASLSGLQGTAAGNWTFQIRDDKNKVVADKKKSNHKGNDVAETMQVKQAGNYSVVVTFKGKTPVNGIGKRTVVVEEETPEGKAKVDIGYYFVNKNEVRLRGLIKGEAKGEWTMTVDGQKPYDSTIETSTVNGYTVAEGAFNLTEKKVHTATVSFVGTVNGKKVKGSNKYTFAVPTFGLDFFFDQKKTLGGKITNAKQAHGDWYIALYDNYSYNGNAGNQVALNEKLNHQGLSYSRQNKSWPGNRWVLPY